MKPPIDGECENRFNLTVWRGQLQCCQRKEWRCVCAYSQAVNDTFGANNIITIQIILLFHRRKSPSFASQTFSPLSRGLFSLWPLDKGVAFLGGGFLLGNLVSLHTVTGVRTPIGSLAWLMGYVLLNRLRHTEHVEVFNYLPNLCYTRTTFPIQLQSPKGNLSKHHLLPTAPIPQIIGKIKQKIPLQHIGLQILNISAAGIAGNAVVLVEQIKHRAFEFTLPI